MTENESPDDGPDIIDQIDELTEPGEDAATWTATGAHELPKWNTPSPGAMTAVLLDMSRTDFVEISDTNPGEDLAHLVGDPAINRISHLRAVSFWVGDNSMVNAPVNKRATRFLHQMLRDVVAGDYLASDRERDHVRRLLHRIGAAPVIHGPCMVTGVDTNGDPAPLGDNFQHWFTALLDGIAQMHHAIGLAVAEALGISPEHISQIVFVDPR